MGWERRVPSRKPLPKCLHPGLMGAVISVGLGQLAQGSKWRCDRCGARWTVVSNGADGTRKLARLRR